MTGVFLPKIFDKYDCGGFAVETQYGENETPPHWHRAFEIIWMRQGSAEMFCFDKWYTLQAGQCVILPPGFLHCIRCTNPQAVKTVVGFAGLRGNRERTLCVSQHGGCLDAQGAGQCVLVPGDGKTVRSTATARCCTDTSVPGIYF